MAFRFFALTAFFGVLFGALGFNLYQLQVKNGAYYVHKVQARQDMVEARNSRRGQIFFTDRNDEKIPVALNQDLPFVYVVPHDITDEEAVADALKSFTDLSREELIRILKNKKSYYRLIVDRVTDEEVAYIKNLGFAGIGIGTGQYRFYPYGTLAAHLLGFVGINAEHQNPTGLYGIEKLYEKTLSEGGDITLTIDRSIQRNAEEILSRLVEKQAAIGGTIIVQEPTTGKILALANAPTFDPNNYRAYPIGRFPNPATQFVFEPGSVFKPLTMAAGIDSGKITPETTYIDTGSITLNGKTIRNWDLKAYGETTMTRVIERSINTGAVFAEQQTGHSTFTKYLYSFGFAKKTNVDLPDEVDGSLRNLERKDAREVDFATASYGQGTAVTPIQLISAFSSISNKGVLMRPFINSEEEPLVVRRVMSPQTSEKVTDMMESAVTKAIVASIPHYTIAGKTGTAFIPDFTYGGYTDDLIHTFVGYAPTNAPRFSILIKLEKPTVGSLAGMTVVPAFRELAQFILNYYNIPPDVISLEE